MEGPGIAEYMVRDAMPGTYAITCRCREPRVVRMQLYRNWGREDVSCVEKVVVLAGEHREVRLAEYEMDFAE